MSVSPHLFSSPCTSWKPAPPHPAPILSGPLPLADGFLQQFPLLFLSVFSASSPEPQRAAVPPSFQEEPFPSLKLPTSLYSISLLPFMIKPLEKPYRHHFWFFYPSFILLKSSAFTLESTQDGLCPRLPQICPPKVTFDLHVAKSTDPPGGPLSGPPQWHWTLMPIPPGHAPPAGRWGTILPDFLPSMAPCSPCAAFTVQLPRAPSQVSPHLPPCSQSLTRSHGVRGHL